MKRTGRWRSLRLNDCGETKICGQIFADDNTVANLDEYQDTQRCLLEAFRDRTAGHLEVETLLSDSGTTMQYIITGAGDVVMQEQRSQNGETELLQSDAVRCSIPDASFFQSCLDTFDRACLDTSAWVGTCESTPLDSCP